MHLAYNMTYHPRYIMALELIIHKKKIMLYIQGQQAIHIVMLTRQRHQESIHAHSIIKETWHLSSTLANHIMLVIQIKCMLM